MTNIFDPQQTFDVMQPTNRFCSISLSNINKNGNSPILSKPRGHKKIEYAHALLSEYMKHVVTTAMNLISKPP